MQNTQRVCASAPVKANPVLRASDKPVLDSTRRDVADNGRIRLGGTMRLPAHRS
jgi:hypothetical protein